MVLHALVRALAMLVLAGVLLLAALMLLAVGLAQLIPVWAAALLTAALAAGLAFTLVGLAYWRLRSLAMLPVALLWAALRAPSRPSHSGRQHERRRRR